MNEFLLLSGPLLCLVNEGGIWLRAGFLWNCLVLRLTVVWWGWEAPPVPEPSEDWRDAVCSSLGFLLRFGPTGNRERNSKFSPQKLVEKIETPLHSHYKESSPNWLDSLISATLLKIYLSTGKIFRCEWISCHLLFHHWRPFIGPDFLIA